MCNFNLMGLLWTNRLGNSVADLVAHIAVSSSLLSNKVSSPLVILAGAIDVDFPLP